MKNSNKLLADFEEILNSSLESLPLPYQKGNSIRIGHVVIRTTKRGYKVFDCTENRQIAETFSKSGAVALARTLALGKNNTNTILDIDKDIQKWHNDCVFYMHSMKKTKDDFRYDVISNRYEIARYKTQQARQRLDAFIFA